MWPVWGFPRPPRWNTGCPPFTQSHTLTEPLWTWALTDLAGSHPASESLAGTRCATSVDVRRPSIRALKGEALIARTEQQVREEFKFFLASSREHLAGKS